MSSGLYQKLTSAGLLVPHSEESLTLVTEPTTAYRVIAPKPIPFILYPYEWSFEQYRAAALATLSILREALDHGLTLKDASAFNIQFIGTSPVFIDTLSFAMYQEGAPWEAYKQFCQHFLAPLLLMGTCDSALGSLMQTHIDGIPLSLASKVLGFKTWLQFGTFTHIHMHARLLNKHSSTHAVSTEVNTKLAKNNSSNRNTARVSKTAFFGLIESLQNSINGIKISKQQTEWGEYYSDTNYTTKAFAHKESLVREFLHSIPTPNKLGLDLGANNGHFSNIMAESFDYVVAADIDPIAVQKNFVSGQKLGSHSAHNNDARSQTVLPALLNLTNPSPAIGFANTERPSFFERFNGQAVLALALIHHIVIGNNVPMHKTAQFFASIAPHLVIEFPEKSDSQVARLLACRQDIFSNYNRLAFEDAFAAFFHIRQSQNIEGTERWLYRMEKR